MRRTFRMVVWCGTVGLLHGQGPTLAEVHAILPHTSDSSHAVQTGDMNGDGLVDVVFVGSSGDDAIWFQTADGGFRRRGAPFWSPVSPSQDPAFTLHDLDGDGDLDACVLDWSMQSVSGGYVTVIGGGLRIHLNDGTGAFQFAQVLGAQSWWQQGELSSSVAVGDVDGDHDADVLIGVRPALYGYTPPMTWVTIWTAYGGRNRLYLNNGNGTFVDATNQLPLHYDSTNSVALADFDGDGDLDAFCGNGPHPAGGIFSFGQDRLYLNQGNGLFVDAPFVSDTLVNLGAAARDFDGDHDVDLLLFDRPQLRYLTNAGNGTFTASTPPLAGLAANAVALLVGDWDQDGWIDYALREPDVLWPVRNQGGAFVAPPGTGVDLSRIRYQALVLVDYERDGDLDLIAPGTNSYRTSLWRHTGGAWQPVPADVSIEWTTRMRGGDLDGDGDLDLLSSTGGPDSARYWRNDGHGRFTIAWNGPFTASPERLEVLALGDLDGDGDLDVATAGSTTGASTVFWNTGGVLQPGPAYFAASRAVAIGDLDGDGDLDLYWSHWPDTVLQNQGQGSFVALPGALPAGTSTTSVVLVDLDTDGDLDVLSRDPSLRVLRNNGSGAFTAWNGTGITSSQGEGGMVVGDFDTDGDSDVVIGTTLWRNGGVGTFTAHATGLPPTSGYVSYEMLRAGDFDDDGDLDLLRSPRTVANVLDAAALFVNDGNGAFTLQPGGVVERGSFAMDAVLGDFDGDRDLDAMWVCQGGPRVLWNRRHQLSWRTLPRVGYGLRLDLDGRAAEPWALAVAAAPVPFPLPVPGLGVLRLDPASLLLAAVGTYDTEGQANWQMQVPASPGLIGLSAYWQALSGAPGRLGNLEVTQLLGQ